MADDTQNTLAVVDGKTLPQSLLVGVDPSGNLVYQFLPRVRGAIVDDANPLPAAPPVATPAAGTASQVAMAATAVIAITGPVKGGYIVNPESAADQGVGTAEQLYVDPVAVPGAAPGAGNGTAVSLDPGASWSLPCPIPAGVTVHVNAASAGHKFTVVVWS